MILYDWCQKLDISPFMIGDGRLLFLRNEIEQSPGEGVVTHPSNPPHQTGVISNEQSEYVGRFKYRPLSRQLF